MTMLSDQSLRNTLEPAVTVMNAFKKASSLKVVYAAWATSKQQDRWYFIGLSAIFLVLGFFCIWLDNNWLFILALIFGTMGVLTFRFRIIDHHPFRHTYGQLDRHFGLNHRFRRYLIFRNHLQSQDIDSDTINRIRRILVAESKLHESRRPKLDFFSWRRCFYSCRPICGHEHPRIFNEIRLDLNHSGFFHCWLVFLLAMESRIPRTPTYRTGIRMLFDLA